MPKIIDHAVMREDLLARSLGLFARRGFHAVTMRDLAAELGVSTGTLYHYFASKTDLYAQMLRARAQRDIARVLASLDEAMPTEARLRVMMRYIGEQEENFRDVLLLAFDFFRYTQSGLDRKERKAADTTRGLFRDLLAAYRDAIEEHSGLPLKGLGQVALGLIIGMLVQRVIDPESAPLNETTAYIQMLLEAQPV